LKKLDPNLSMLETAEVLISRKVKPQKWNKIAKEVFEALEIKDTPEKLAQLYSDLTLSGKFVTVGEDMWDLKSRQAFEVADYDTYDLDFENEENVPLLGEDLVGKIEDNEAADDYSGDSNAEVKDNSKEEHSGLTVYRDDEIEKE